MPENERTFAENLIQIMSSPYGADVRLAIRDALQQAYDHTEEGADSATDATLDSLTSALADALGLTVSKVYDAVNDRYLYTIGVNDGEPTSGNGYVVIDDNDVATNKTWSSSKLNSKFEEIEETFEALETILADL